MVYSSISAMHMVYSYRMTIHIFPFFHIHLCTDCTVTSTCHTLLYSLLFCVLMIGDTLYLFVLSCFYTDWDTFVRSVLLCHFPMYTLKSMYYVSFTCFCIRTFCILPHMLRYLCTFYIFLYIQTLSCFFIHLRIYFGTYVPFLYFCIYIRIFASFIYAYIFLYFRTFYTQFIHSSVSEYFSYTSVHFLIPGTHPYTKVYVLYECIRSIPKYSFQYLIPFLYLSIYPDTAYISLYECICPCTFAHPVLNIFSVLMHFVLMYFYCYIHL